MIFTGSERPAFAGSRTARRGLAVFMGVALLGMAPASAHAESAGSEAGWGAGSALCSLLYAPTKVVYALGGSIIGGFAWIFSAGDNDVAKAVITPAVRGDYVVTPAHLRGEEPLEFIGREPAPAPTYGASPTPPAY
ncbi:MAG: hypothetical protein QNK04_03545 [Myxococcota bacterium]|nr:hypothetical protein [Myxococcota bacterium]